MPWRETRVPITCGFRFGSITVPTKDLGYSLDYIRRSSARTERDDAHVLQTLLVYWEDVVLGNEHLSKNLSQHLQRREFECSDCAGIERV